LTEVRTVLRVSSLWNYRLLAALITGAFPIIFLAVKHAGDNIRVIDVLVALVLTLIGIMAFAGVMRLVVRDKSNTTILVWIAVAMFFSYGPLQEILRDTGIGEYARHRFMYPAYGLVFFAATLSMVFTRRQMGGFLVLVTIVGSVLIVVNPGGVVSATVTELPTAGDDFVSLPEATNLAGTRLPPDIYYVLLDGYASGDTLTEMYQHDNEGFLGHLRERGFKIIDDAQTNYEQTIFSVPSTLNLRYTQPDDPFAPFWVDQSLLAEGDTPSVIHRSVAAVFARDIGYKIVGIRASGKPVAQAGNLLFSPFSNRLRDLTPLRIKWEKTENLWASQSGIIEYESNVLKVAYIAKDPAPTFTFLYSNLPHPPFIFQQSGQLREVADVAADGDWIPRERYVDQLIFTNNVLTEMIDEILDQSESEPLILIHADHGPRSIPYERNSDQPPPEEVISERFGIITAVLIPPQCDQGTWTATTPVNFARSIFNICFGAGFELLDDESYIFDHGDRSFYEVRQP
jgi:hypothetical protein